MPSLLSTSFERFFGIVKRRIEKFILLRFGGEFSAVSHRVASSRICDFICIQEVAVAGWKQPEQEMVAYRYVYGASASYRLIWRL